MRHCHYSCLSTHTLTYTQTHTHTHPCCAVTACHPAGGQHTQQQQQTHTRLGYLNQRPEEVIRSLVVNTHDSSVVTVSCLTSDNAVLLHCTSTPAQRR